MATANFDKRLENWKEAYNTYVSNEFTKKEDSHICRVLLLKGVELINEGIVSDQKSVFRKNRDFIFAIKALLMHQPKLTDIQKDIIKKSMENFKLYSIVKVQGMKY